MQITLSTCKFSTISIFDPLPITKCTQSKYDLRPQCPGPPCLSQLAAALSPLACLSRGARPRTYLNLTKTWNNTHYPASTGGLITGPLFQISFKISSNVLWLCTFVDERWEYEQFPLGQSPIQINNLINNPILEWGNWVEQHRSARATKINDIGGEGEVIIIIIIYLDIMCTKPVSNCPTNIRHTRRLS